MNQKTDGKDLGFAYQIETEVCRILSPENSVFMAEVYPLFIDLLIKIQRPCLNTWFIPFSTYEKNITFL